jgi:hypothetical protein
MNNSALLKYLPLIVLSIVLSALKLAAFLVLSIRVFPNVGRMIGTIIWVGSETTAGLMALFLVALFSFSGFVSAVFLKKLFLVLLKAFNAIQNRYSPKSTHVST